MKLLNFQRSNHSIIKNLLNYSASVEYMAMPLMVLQRNDINSIK